MFFLARRRLSRHLHILIMADASIVICVLREAIYRQILMTNGHLCKRIGKELKLVKAGDLGKNFLCHCLLPVC